VVKGFGVAAGVLASVLSVAYTLYSWHKARRLAAGSTAAGADEAGGGGHYVEMAGEALAQPLRTELAMPKAEVMQTRDTSKYHTGGLAPNGMRVVQVSPANGMDGPGTVTLFPPQ
jgi:hypothetical protein